MLELNKKPNSKCVVCGKEYYLCSTCEKKKRSGLLHYKGNCDTPECFQIFMIVNDYNSKLINEIEAKEQLDNISFDYKNLHFYTNGIINAIDKILSEVNKDFHKEVSNEEIIKKPKQKTKKVKKFEDEGGTL